MGLGLEVTVNDNNKKCRTHWSYPLTWHTQRYSKEGKRSTEERIKVEKVE